MIVPEGESKEFLGQEFLTWLWFYGETNEWSIPMGNEQIHYGMDELLVLEPDDITGCTQRLAGPVPVKSPEARVGLMEGKKVSTARIIIVYLDNEWSITSRGDNFNFSSVKLMNPTTADEEGRFSELSEDLEQVVQIFDHMFHFFLQIRLSKEWEEKELPAIYAWVKPEKS